MDEYVDKQLKWYSETKQNGKFMYHIMEHGMILEEYYSAIGDVMDGVSCDCDGTDNKFHRHFILMTKYKIDTLRVKTKRHLRKLMPNMRHRFYTRSKQIVNHAHLLATMFYIWCEGTLNGHKHYNTKVYSLTTRQKIALLRDYCDKYDEKYNTRKDLNKFVMQNSYYECNFIR